MAVGGRIRSLATMLAVLSGLVAGFLHVLAGPDHLAAVAPLAVRSHRRAWMSGVRWGLGHSAGVLLIGLLAILFKSVLPIGQVSSVSERLVGVLLIAMGIWTVRQALHVEVHAHEHAHDGRMPVAMLRRRSMATGMCISTGRVTRTRFQRRLRLRSMATGMRPSGSAFCTDWPAVLIFSECCPRWDSLMRGRRCRIWRRSASVRFWPWRGSRRCSGRWPVGGLSTPVTGTAVFCGRVRRWPLPSEVGGW